MATSRIALVSTDEKTVNDHFGRADFFLIYDLDEELTFVEKRVTERYSVDDPNHSFDPERFGRVTALLRDCSKIYVTQIGEDPASKLKEIGIEPVIYTGPIADIR